MDSMPPPVRRMLTSALKKATEEESDKRLQVASLEGQLTLAKKNVKELQAAITYIEELINATQPILQ